MYTPPDCGTLDSCFAKHHDPHVGAKFMAAWSETKGLIQPDFKDAVVAMDILKTLSAEGLGVYTMCPQEYKPFLIEADQTAIQNFCRAVGLTWSSDRLALLSALWRHGVTIRLRYIPVTGYWTWDTIAKARSLGPGYFMALQEAGIGFYEQDPRGFREELRSNAKAYEALRHLGYPPGRASRYCSRLFDNEILTKYIDPARN